MHLDLLPLRPLPENYIRNMLKQLTYYFFKFNNNILGFASFYTVDV